MRVGREDRALLCLAFSVVSSHRRTGAGEVSSLLRSHVPASLSLIKKQNKNIKQTLQKQRKHLDQRVSEPRDFDFIQLKCAARHLFGQPKAALPLRRQDHVDRITVFVGSDFPGDPVSKTRTTGLVAHMVKSGCTLQSVTAMSNGEAEGVSVSLQHWCSTDHGSHTPLQDDRRHVDTSRLGGGKEKETDNCRN